MKRAAKRGSGSRSQGHENVSNRWKNAKIKTTATSSSQKVAKSATGGIKLSKHRKNLPRSDDEDSSGSEAGGAPSTARASVVPDHVAGGRYCLFCFEHNGTKRHHSILKPSELQDLEKDIQQIRRELHASKPDVQMDLDSVGRATGFVQPEHESQRYSVLLWQLERAKELQQKGFGATFDLWIDHLTLLEMVDDGWTYDAVRSKIPDDWIEDPDLPTFLSERQARFPPGAEQKGDIDADVAGMSEEEMLDALDDHEQNAEADMYRIRNMSPIPGQVHEDDEEDEQIGDNLGLEAANAAMDKLRRKTIPQTIRMWRDNARPFTHGDSKLQMKNYIKDIYPIMEPNSTLNPSMETYRAIANIAFSMEAADRLWKKQGITDEGYSKLTKDGFKQLKSLRSSLDKAGVINLPPIPGLPASQPPMRQKPIKPFVIDHWMDSKENELHRPYVYRPDRPLGPMISENAHTSHYANEKGSGVSIDKNGYVNLREHTNRSSKIKLSREELMGTNMELDQLVESD